MKAVLNSATKIVLLLMAISLVWLTAFWKVSGEQFLSIATMVFMAYYVDKKNTTPPDPSTSTHSTWTQQTDTKQTPTI